MIFFYQRPALTLEDHQAAYAYVLKRLIAALPRRINAALKEGDKLRKRAKGLG